MKAWVACVTVLWWWCAGSATVLRRGLRQEVHTLEEFRGITFETHNYEQKLDHFNYGVQPITFMQKYLINVDSWNRTGGPIFFYTGNEGSIELFALNTITPPRPIKCCVPQLPLLCTTLTLIFTSSYPRKFHLFYSGSSCAKLAYTPPADSDHHRSSLLIM
ncbi:Peptidase S28 [Trinorchestia longiramus]|nr:Peptidase S28 [Trinorchestia longiramus]